MEARSAPILCNGRLMCPTLMHLQDDEIVKVWDAVSHFIRRQFALNKGVTVPGLGTFFAVKQDRPMAGVKLLDAKKPVFQVSEHFANVHGLPYKKETFPGILFLQTSSQQDSSVAVLEGPEATQLGLPSSAGLS
nr:coiled-coil domain-containing protein 81-like [Anas platyrhynchos]